MNFISINGCKLLHIIVLLISTAWASEREPNLFKLGIELQEGTRLCAWADGQIHLQKEPIFSVFKGVNKLWDVVIDTRDIEFVTVPFSNHDKESLNECMQTIMIACEVLKDLNRNNKYPGAVTFEKWVEGESILKIDDSYTEEDIDQLYIKGLRERLTENFTVDVKGIYSYIKGNPLMTPGEPKPGDRFWEPVFKPQVTIQHRLEKTIPLFLSLFCFDSRYAQENEFHDYNINYVTERRRPTITTQEIIDTLFSVRFYDKEVNQPLECFPITSEIKFENKTSSIDGLLFLHTYTCLCLSLTFEPDDIRSTGKILEHFSKSRQVDAKRNLGLLSRRPFSVMWDDISHLYPDERFVTIQAANVATQRQEEFSMKFSSVNYAEEYIDYQKKRVDLTYLRDLFPNPTRSLLLLLQNGIISTSMLRQMDQLAMGPESIPVTEIFSQYYRDVINSVDTPLSGYKFDLKTKVIKAVERKVDALSPPYFLAHTDSMGAYKDHMDLSYGEAVVEIREIENIGAYALQWMGLSFNDHNGKFLTNERINGDSSALLSQTKALFLFIESKLA